MGRWTDARPITIAIAVSLAGLAAACGSPDAPADRQPNSTASARPTLVSEKDIANWEPFDPSRAGARVLLFDFPDGVRGGRGDIQGLAAVDHSMPADSPETIIEQCGGSILPTAPPVTHHEYVMISSGPGDLEIVRCLQRATYRHFSVSQIPVESAPMAAS